MPIGSYGPCPPVPAHRSLSKLLTHYPRMCGAHGKWCNEPTLPPVDAARGLAASFLLTIRSTNTSRTPTIRGSPGSAIKATHAAHTRYTLACRWHMCVAQERRRQDIVRLQHFVCVRACVCCRIRKLFYSNNVCRIVRLGGGRDSSAPPLRVHIQT